MAGIDEVLERLANEPGFRTRLTSRPALALAGYDLSEEEREQLALQLIQSAGRHRLVTSLRVHVPTCRSVAGPVAGTGDLPWAVGESRA